MSLVNYSEKAKSLKRGKYLQYKNLNYEVIDVVLHSETLEELVLYKPLYDNPVKLWVRPISMFTENVIVDGREVLRFKYLGE